MKKILHIITRLEKGGSSKNVIYSMNLYGFDSYLIYGPSNLQEEIYNLNKEKIFEIKNLQREISIFKDIKALYEIFLIIRKIKPDIVHSHTSKAGILGRMAALIYNLTQADKVVVVHTPHGHLFYGYYGKLKTTLFKYLEFLFSFITDYFIALTEGEKKENISASIGNENKWIVIHSGIDFPGHIINKIESRKKIKIDNDVFAIGCVARLERVKGIEILIRAAYEMEKTRKINKVKYFIIGDGKDKEKLKKLVIDLNLSDKIIFLGQVDNVFEILPSFDIYVQPSLNEAMGRAVIEAQYCSLPVIASDACGLPYSMIENETGFLFERGNYKELSDKIYALFSDDIKRNLFSLNARKFVETKENGYLKFSTENMNFKLSSFYKKIFN